MIPVPTPIRIPTPIPTSTATATIALDAARAASGATASGAGAVAAATDRPLPLVPLAAEASSGVSIGPVRGAVVALLVAIGFFFLFVGTVGLVRLPTVYNRMHATSKATTLGAGVVALAGFVFYGLDPAAPGGDGLLALVTVVFLFLTAPTGAHMISRAAQRMGVPFVEGVDWPGPGFVRGGPGDGPGGPAPEADPGSGPGSDPDAGSGAGDD